MKKRGASVLLVALFTYLALTPAIAETPGKEDIRRQLLGKELARESDLYEKARAELPSAAGDSDRETRIKEEISNHSLNMRAIQAEMGQRNKTVRPIVKVDSHSNNPEKPVDVEEKPHLDREKVPYWDVYNRQ